MKRLSCVFSFFLMIVVCGISVYAAEGPAFKVSMAEAYPGEKVTLTIETVGNPGIASFDLKVEYDTSRLEWVEVEKGNLKGTMDVAVDHTITWFDADNNMDNTVVATLVFQVKPDSPDGYAMVSVSYQKGDVFDIDEKDVDFEVISGGIKVKKNTTADDKYIQVESFVSRLYSNFLRREADESELASWSGLLYSGKTTGSHVVYGFVYSKEFQNNPLDNEAFVTAMYETIFGREPDMGGMNSWVAVLEKGCTRKKVLAGFLNSEEMRYLCDSIGIRPGSYESDEIIDHHTKVTYFVSRMYKNCLGRQADYPGLTAWVSALVEGRATGSKVAAGFFFSPEMEQKELSNRDYVFIAYLALLDREPDLDGMNSWVAALDRENDREIIVSGFVKSVEFGNLCNEYGIIR